MKTLCYKGTTALLLTLALATCGDETGTPQPLPIPSPKEMRLGGAMPEAEQNVEIVGLPGAVGGAGRVTIVNGDKTFAAQSTAEGTFYLVITARAYDELAVSYETSEPASISVPELSIAVPGLPGPVPGVDPITPQGDGHVLVRGQMAVETTSGTALVVNSTTGAVALGDIGADATFAVEIAATSGDHLMVFLDKDVLGGAWELDVP